MAQRDWPRPCRGHAYFTWLLALVILGCCAVVVDSSRCKVDSCSQDFEHSRLTNGIRRGPNARYCALLRSYTDCLRGTARSCRGHLSYHAMTRLVQQWTSDFNCSYVLNYQPVEENAVPLDPTAPALHRPLKNPSATDLPDTCTYNGRAPLTHCSLFGDPHLVTFGGDFQTCRVSGAWPLVDNAYLAISVTNEAVIPGRSATATTKVTIIIKGSLDCSPERTYEASVDSVPASFVDGSQWGGVGVAEHHAPVRVVEKEPGRHVEITARHLGATFVVRQVGRYLTFAARMPRDIADQSALREGLQLCVKGCPSSERIDIASTLRALPSSVERVQRALCQQHNVSDYYLDSCIFDLVTTGDASFALSAQKAQSDYVALLPDAAPSRHSNSTRLPPASAATSSGVVCEAHGPGRPLLFVLTWMTMMSLWKLT